MSAPLLLIAFPLAAALAIYPISRWRGISTFLAALLSLLLALLAWQLPVGGGFTIPLAGEITIDAELQILGRRLILDESHRMLTALIYLSAFFWLAGGFSARVRPLFPATGLAVAAVITAAVAAQPPAYGVLFLLLAVLMSVPLLSPPGVAPRRGVLRLITVFLFGMAVILFASRFLELSPRGGEHILVMTVLGFALLNAMFPFHSWVVMLSDEAQPYQVGLALFFILGASSIFSLLYLHAHPSLLTNGELFAVLRFIGLLTAAAGGIWAVFQRHLGRIFGFAFVSEAGLAFTAIGLREEGLFLMLLLVRLSAMLVWAFGLSVIRVHAGSLSFPDVRGSAWSRPLAAAGVILGGMSLAGFPMLAGFPSRAALWSSLASESPAAVLLAMSAFAGLMVANLRSLVVLTAASDEQSWKFEEGHLEAIFLLGGVLFLFLVGLLPHLFQPPLTALAAMLF